MPDGETAVRRGDWAMPGVAGSECKGGARRKRRMRLAAVITKQMGLSLGNAEQMLGQGFGVPVNRSTLGRVLLRMNDLVPQRRVL